MPLLLIALVALFIVPSLLRKKTTSGISSSTRAADTIGAMNLIDKAEQTFRSVHGHFSPHLSDLLNSSLAKDLAAGLSVQLDVGAGGQRYLAQVDSGVLSLVRGRSEGTINAEDCAVLTNASGVSCPPTSK